MRAEGHWAQSIPYFEQALALDPRNVELLRATALTYAMLKQFPAALKLFDRLLVIYPSDPDLMAHMASIYQAEGNLQQAAMLLSGISEPSSWFPFSTKASQLQYEHNYGELIRLLQARLAQSRLDGQFEKARFQVRLASTQHCSGDTAGAKVTAQLARNTLEQLYRDQPGDYYSRFGSIPLCEAYAVMGENALALNQAQRAVRLYPRAKDPVDGPMYEESLAVVQTLIGENSRAIATITGLLRTPYESWNYKPTGITPALLRLDPIWDPLRGDPAFQKLCEEKQPPATP